MRTAVVVCAAAVIVATVGCARAGVRVEAVGARIPRDAARFEIESVDDSTASFRVFEARWIRSGQLAYVVDPAQRDALVARLRIVRRDGSVATALITSQAARVTTEQAVLVVRPPTPWWRTRVFWYGVATGGVLGAGTAAAAR
ncbi:MAG: hypothetical protein P3B76_03275 [Gemmatimonadota bacterium]|nr:hypothetical protein [Gemmatimonadota bacterium]MDQ8171685.1 hypothetical protein [Gemmatimonadota bacterium]